MRTINKREKEKVIRIIYAKGFFWAKMNMLAESGMSMVHETRPATITHTQCFYCTETVQYGVKYANFV